MIDFVPSKEDIKNGTTDPRRKFTVLALSNETEFLSLSIENLEEIKKDFIDVYDELFMHAISHLWKLTDLWNKAKKELEDGVIELKIKQGMKKRFLNWKKLTPYE